VISVVIHRRRIELNADVARFLSEFETAQFNHASKLVSGLKSGAINLHSAPRESRSPVSHYLNIYEFRLKRLDQRSESQQTEHTKSLLFDTANLCNGLQSQPTDTCELWSFTETPYFTYGVFIGHESRMILGCIRAVDNRLVNPEIRTELWGEPASDSGG
jgi:hypothetical protein